MKKADAADFPKFESDLLKVWEKEQTFQKSLDNRKDGERFSFYDGPPFANGLPHYGHVVAITQKDAITRYKTMRGYYVPRRNGWDTHGLPVEYEVEKALGISGKRQIQEMGIDKFNQACRDSVFKYKQQWEDFMTRLGRWADQGSYATMDDDYIESVWWVLAELHKKNLVYQGFKSMPYCPRCATPLSNFEVNQNYKDDTTDPSVYVTFPLTDEPDTSMLAWTTTPWTLPANAALAVDKDASYVIVQVGEQNLIVAEKRLEVLKDDNYKVIKKLKGKDLVGKAYQPLFETATDSQTVWHIYDDVSVSLDDGTGILHVAPRYGETDLALGQRENLPLIESVDGNGLMSVGNYKGMFFKKADDHIIADLTNQGRVFAAEKFTHTYPFCWRCETPLMYFATPSWFVKVTQTTDDLVANNQKISWVPDHIKEGRFGNWLAEARDWSISRNRFWGAPIPIWQCAQGHSTVIGSIEELKAKALNPNEVSDLHRPGIDAIKIKCSECGGEAGRVEEVFDCWFESGSMPYAQNHYPFENKAEVEANFPAQFIAEGIDQTRGWFYTLHVLATALFNKPAFKNVIVNGLVLAADGKKLSKRLRNYPDPQELFDNYGADSLRYFLMSSPVVAGEDVRFSAEAVGDVHRNLFMTIWNVHSFLTTYAEVDGWEPSPKLQTPKSQNLLDLWLLARLNETIAEVTKQADGFQIARATRPIRELVEDLSNWYVRRSRRRFKSDDAADKQAAYETLHYALARVSQLLAPWAPFLADKLWRDLGGEDSVHLSDWPTEAAVDSKVVDEMQKARNVIKDALSQRAEQKIKVRQPLSSLWIVQEEAFTDQILKIVAEEVNVKEIKLDKPKKAEPPYVHLQTNITPELKSEGLARDIIRAVQNERKLAGLNPGDRVELLLSGTAAELEAINTHNGLIATETLADKIETASSSKLEIKITK